MKIVLFGLSVSSAWGNGHATHWRGILRALGRNGHEVVFFERDTPYYAAHRDLPVGDGYEIVAYPSWSAVEPRARAAVASADAVIVTSYQADAALATALVLGAASGKRVFYDLDSPVTLELGDDAPWLPAGGFGGFDLVLSFTGGPTLDAIAARFGARRVGALYGCVDEATHRPAPGAGGEKARWALSYLGTYAEDRQQAMETLLLSVAEQRPEQQFILAGPMYPASMRRPPNLTTRDHLSPAEHPAFYSASSATLNVTRAAMKRSGFSPSARLFEAAACGAPLLTDAWEGTSRFFEPGREVIVVETTDDVVRALAEPPSMLREMAERARARTLAEHPATRRAEELLDFLR